MNKRVYISADYSPEDGDRKVVDVLNTWGTDNLRMVNFIDMAKVVKGSVSNNPDCRPCELKQEFNKQINASSAVIFVVGNKTAQRTAGSSCLRNKDQNCFCTPYKQNTNGRQTCKIAHTTGAIDDVGNINQYSYLQHEFKQAEKRQKTIIIVYNSTRNETDWLPGYMTAYTSHAFPFWINTYYSPKIGDYSSIKRALGYE